MFVTKKKYNKALDLADDAMDGWGDTLHQAMVDRKIHAHTEQHLRSAESALAYKEDVIEELQAEVYELTVSHKNLNGNMMSQGKMIRAANEERDEAVARAEAAEKALAAATKISYVVALHERDVPAAPRYASLDTAYGEYMNATKPDVQETANGIFPHYPYHIFALRGDEVIADVTDPRYWNERLPVSEKREEFVSNVFHNSIWNTLACDNYLREELIKRQQEQQGY